MHRKTQGLQACATHCDRIEFVRSPRLVLLWVCWCALACLVAALAVQLPSIVRWLLVLAITVAGVHGFRYLCLGGGTSVRAVRWTRDGGLFLCAEPVGPWIPARLGSWFRFGAVWLLEFRTAEGGRRLAVDVRCHNPKALRRLARSLEWGAGPPELIPSRRKV